MWLLIKVSLSLFQKRNYNVGIGGTICHLWSNEWQTIITVSPHLYIYLLNVFLYWMLCQREYKTCIVWMWMTELSTMVVSIFIILVELMHEWARYITHFKGIKWKSNKHTHTNRLLHCFDKLKLWGWEKSPIVTEKYLQTICIDRRKTSHYSECNIYLYIRILNTKYWIIQNPSIFIL